MDWQEIFEKYVGGCDSELRRILLVHSRAVADRAVRVAMSHPELQVDTPFVEAAAMLHDIGIVRCHAPGIQCFGTEPYLRHGQEGAKMLRDLKNSEGLSEDERDWIERLARVCERHTGTGIVIDGKDFSPETLEEQLVCYADKFYSKTHLDREKTFEQACRSLEKFGPAGIGKLRQWRNCFEPSPDTP